MTLSEPLTGDPGPYWMLGTVVHDRDDSTPVAVCDG